MTVFPWNRVVVAGMARSGTAAARLLTRHGVRVLATDVRSAAELDLDITEPSLAGVEWVLGEQPERVLDGAEALVVSPGIPKTAPLLTAARGRGLPLVSELEVASRAARAPMAAVTGTNGKSTVVSLVGSIASAHGRPCTVAGNVGTALSDVVETIPAEGLLVVEVSSYQLEDIDTFHPRAGCVLNITPDHLDRYRDMDHYAQTKWRIVENQTEADMLVIPAGDPAVTPPPGSRARTVHFGEFSGAWRAPAVLVKDDLLIFDDGEPHVVTGLSAFPLLGRHNALNAAAAVAVAYGMGLDPRDRATKQGLKNARALPHRMEPVGTVEGVRFVDDSKATNPEATLAALTSLEGPRVLIAGGRAKDSDYRVLVPALDPEFTLGIALVGEAQDRLAQDWAPAGVPIHRAGTNFKEAVAWAWEQAWPQKALVLLSPACASFDMFRDFEHRGNAFRDAVLALGGTRR